MSLGPLSARTQGFLQERHPSHKELAEFSAGFEHIQRTIRSVGAQAATREFNSYTSKLFKSLQISRQDIFIVLIDTGTTVGGVPLYKTALSREHNQAPEAVYNPKKKGALRTSTARDLPRHIAIEHAGRVQNNVSVVSDLNDEEMGLLQKVQQTQLLIEELIETGTTQKQKEVVGKKQQTSKQTERRTALPALQETKHRERAYERSILKEGSLFSRSQREQERHIEQERTRKKDERAKQRRQIANEKKQYRKDLEQENLAQDISKAQKKK